MSERQIDDAIDEAVRDLMNVDADTAFRARVVERLRKPKSQAPFWRQLSIVSGAVGIAVIAVLLTRGVGKPAVEPAPAAVTSAVQSQPAVEPRVAEPSAPASTRPPVQSAARRRAENPTQQIARGALAATVADDAPAPPPADGIEPLGHIRPIALTPITPEPIVTTEIAIAPLAPPSGLAIVPLAPQIERE
jgi:hypothetical protein